MSRWLPDVSTAVIVLDHDSSLECVCACHCGECVSLLNSFSLSLSGPQGSLLCTQAWLPLWYALSLPTAPCSWHTSSVASWWWRQLEPDGGFLHLKWIIYQSHFFSFSFFFSFLFFYYLFIFGRAFGGPSLPGDGARPAQAISTVVFSLLFHPIFIVSGPWIFNHLVHLNSFILCWPQ